MRGEQKEEGKGEGTRESMRGRERPDMLGNMDTQDRQGEHRMSHMGNQTKEVTQTPANTDAQEGIQKTKRQGEH